MQPPRPTERHCPRRAATEARTLSVLRRLIRAVKGVCKPGVDPSRAAVAALGALPDNHWLNTRIMIGAIRASGTPPLGGPCVRTWCRARVDRSRRGAPDSAGP